MSKTLLRSLEPSISRLIAQESAMQGKARVVAFREKVRELSAKITGAGRRSMPTPEHWARIVVELDRMLKDRNCPLEVRRELEHAQRQAIARMQALTNDGAAFANPVCYGKKLLSKAQKGPRGRPGATYRGDRARPTHEMVGTIGPDGARVNTTLHPIRRGKKQPRRAEDVLDRALPFRTGGPPHYVNDADLEADALRSGRGGIPYGSW